MREKYINLIVKNNSLNTHSGKFLESYFFGYYPRDSYHISIESFLYSLAHPLLGGHGVIFRGGSSIYTKNHQSMVAEHHTNADCTMSVPKTPQNTL